MTEPEKDKELESNTKGKEKEETADQEDKSGSTTSGSSDGEAKKCIDVVDFFATIAKGIVIGEPKRSKSKTGKSKIKPAAAGKRRKRAHGGIRRSISLRSRLSEIGMSFDSDSEPTNAELVAKKEQKDKEKDDVFHGSDNDSDEACKRMKKGKKNDDDDDLSGSGAGTGSGTHTGN